VLKSKGSRKMVSSKKKGPSARTWAFENIG
jgi:hypothetical protein